MLATLSGIVTLVSPLQPENAEDPTPVPVYPPNLDGIVIAPEVDVGIARVDDVPPPTLAYPLVIVYVHVIPFTVSV